MLHARYHFLPDIAAFVEIDPAELIHVAPTSGIEHRAGTKEQEALE